MDITSLLFPLLILLLFIPIFLSGRRQRRQVQEMQALQSALEAGDVVMTTSGLRATVVDASYEDTIDLEIADGVVTTWVRAAVKEKVPAAVDPDAPIHDGAIHDGAIHDGAVHDGPVGDDAIHDDAVVTTPAQKTGPADVPDAPLSLEKDDSANGTSRT